MIHARVTISATTLVLALVGGCTHKPSAPRADAPVEPKPKATETSAKLAAPDAGPQERVLTSPFHLVGEGTSRLELRRIAKALSSWPIVTAPTCESYETHGAVKQSNKALAAVKRKHPNAKLVCTKPIADKRFEVR